MTDKLSNSNNFLCKSMFNMLAKGKNIALRGKGTF